MEFPKTEYKQIVSFRQLYEWIEFKEFQKYSDTTKKYYESLMDLRKVIKISILSESSIRSFIVNKNTRLKLAKTDNKYVEFNFQFKKDHVQINIKSYYAKLELKKYKNGQMYDKNQGTVKSQNIKFEYDLENAVGMSIDKTNKIESKTNIAIWNDITPLYFDNEDEDPYHQMTFSEPFDLTDIVNFKTYHDKFMASAEITSLLKKLDKPGDDLLFAYDLLDDIFLEDEFISTGTGWLLKKCESAKIKKLNEILSAPKKSRPKKVLSDSSSKSSASENIDKREKNNHKFISESESSQSDDTEKETNSIDGKQPSETVKSILKEELTDSAINKSPVLKKRKSPPASEKLDEQDSVQNEPVQKTISQTIDEVLANRSKKSKKSVTINASQPELDESFNTNLKIAENSTSSDTEKNCEKFKPYENNFKGIDAVIRNHAQQVLEFLNKN